MTNILIMESIELKKKLIFEELCKYQLEVYEQFVQFFTEYKKSEKSYEEEIIATSEIEINEVRNLLISRYG